MLDYAATNRENVVDFFDQKPNISADKQAEPWDRLLTMGGISPVDIMLERNPDLTREEAKARLLATKATFFLEGWVTAPELPAVEKLLSRYTAAWETCDPVQDEYPEVPVKLKSNALTRPMNMVTEMYSLPAYDGVDPNPLMMPFFVFFFGIMFADLGYGIILTAFSLIVRKKAKPKGTMGYLFGLMTMVGISTAIIGFFTGGFFSDAITTVSGLLGVQTPNLSFLTKPVISVLDNPLGVLVICLIIGCVQLLFGMGVKAYMLIRDGHPLDALFDIGSWWVLFAGIAVGVLTGSWIVIWIGVAMLVLTQGRASHSIPGKIIGGLASLYNITGYFGDGLSYSRLMVMMLAGSVIGSIFNLLGSMPGNIFIFAVVFLVGHTFNMGLNIIGTFVHDARLQYLEYFGKFYKEGGRPFRPLAIHTKFVDIIKEESKS
jgi:V/A-type H+-transporting ATPase subunit I